MATISLTRVAPTVDTSVYSIILANWIGPLTESFVETQRGIEEREERYKNKPRPMRKVRLPSTARRSDKRGKKTQSDEKPRG